MAKNRTVNDTKMSALSVRLPDSIRRNVRKIAEHDGVSVNQFISTAVSEKISAIMTEEYLAERAKRARKGDLKRILDRVPDREPLAGDEL